MCIKTYLFAASVIKEGFYGISQGAIRLFEQVAESITIYQLYLMQFVGFLTNVL